MLLQARRAESDIIAALVYRGLDRAAAMQVLHSLTSGRSPVTVAQPLTPSLSLSDGERVVNRRALTLVVGALVVVIFLLLVCLLPWPKYQLALWRDNEPAYARFVERHPDSKWTPAANEKLRKLREEPVWTASLNSGEAQPLRDYLETYPDGKHLAEARAAIEELAQSQWLTVSQSSSEEEIRAFLRQFADTKVVPDARHRLQEVLAEMEWLSVRRSGQIARLRDYIAQNPDSRFLQDARAELDRLYQEKWKAVASSESEQQLRAFSREFAGTPLKELADRRIAELYYDLNWLAGKNSIAAYQHHLALYPASPYRAQIEKRIIDLEVADILASNPGRLPPSVLIGPASSALTLAEVTIQNDTGYELTLRYSGAESRKLVLGVSAKQTVHLPPGSYIVTASADKARNVQSFAGRKTFEANIYTDRYYIRSGLDLPNFRQPLPRLNVDDLLRRVR